MLSLNLGLSLRSTSAYVCSMHNAAGTKSQKVAQEDLRHFIRNKLAVIVGECDLLVRMLSGHDCARLERIKQAVREIAERMEHKDA